MAVWIVANAAVLAFLVVNPRITRSLCDGHWIDDPVDWFRSVTSDEEFGEDACAVETSPLAERGEVVTGALLGNCVVLGLWTTTGRAGSLPSN